jgi:hypothetical protein
MKRAAVLTVVVLALSACVSLPHGSVFLADQSVPFKGQQGRVDIGDYDGWFRALFFKVERNDVEIFNMVVTYGNGEREKSIPDSFSTKVRDLVSSISKVGNAIYARSNSYTRLSAIGSMERL